METTSDTPQSRRLITIGVLALCVLLLLPIMGLALIDIVQGAESEDLALEWWVVSVGLIAIGIAQVVILILLWRRGVRTRGGR